MLLCAVAFLWFRLIDHLRGEWSVNPQYAYGWAVPFLCLYLLWKRRQAKNTGEEGGWKIEEGGKKPAPALYVLVALGAVLYAPTRLVQEANPEWRLVSWALALQVIVMTLALVSLLTAQRPFSILPLRASAFVFPLCFFLVAVPWPTVLEGPLIQGLTRADSSFTVELLGLLGVPAVKQGNTIEVGTGVVGIDEACSGIRSFQATLMVSLFFGELYRLRVWQRVGLCCSGFALSLLFNTVRTTLLTAIAANRGTAAIARWHDPAGVAILVGCFGALWLLALGLKARAQARRENSGWRMAEKGAEEGLRGFHPPSSISHPPSSLPAALPFWILLWVMVVEVGTEGWYRLHERELPPPVTWTVALPRERPGFHEVPLSENTRRFLRFDEFQTATWQEGAEHRLQAFYFRWNPGRVAAYLARSHTPAVCLTASGHELMSQTEPRAFTVHGLQLPFRSYVFKDAGAPLRVYYCLWEDRALAHAFGPTSMSYRNRFAPVLAGYRNSGQRSFELAMWGIADDQEADAEFQRQLECVIRPEQRVSAKDADYR